MTIICCIFVVSEGFKKNYFILNHCRESRLNDSLKFFLNIFFTGHLLLWEGGGWHYKNLPMRFLAVKMQKSLEKKRDIYFQYLRSKH